MTFTVKLITGVKKTMVEVNMPCTLICEHSHIPLGKVNIRVHICLQLLYYSK